MTQVPPPGTKVRRGWSIRVAQFGPLRVGFQRDGGSERVAELNIRPVGSVWGRRARQFAGRAAGPVYHKAPPECQRRV